MKKNFQVIMEGNTTFNLLQNEQTLQQILDTIKSERSDFVIIGNQATALNKNKIIAIRDMDAK